MLRGAQQLPPVAACAQEIGASVPRRGQMGTAPDKTARQIYLTRRRHRPRSPSRRLAILWKGSSLPLLRYRCSQVQSRPEKPAGSPPGSGPLPIHLSPVIPARTASAADT